MGLHRNGFNYTSHALVASRNSHRVISELLYRCECVCEFWWDGVPSEREDTPSTTPPTQTFSTPFKNRQEGRLRPEISRRVLTEGQRDTVLRMNGHVTLSML